MAHAQGKFILKSWSRQCVYADANTTDATEKQNGKVYIKKL